MGRNVKTVRTLSGPLKTAASGLFSLCCVLFAVWLFCHNEIREGVAVLALSAVFAAVFVRIFAYVAVDERGVCQKRLFRAPLSLPWEAFQEVGVLNGDAFPMPHKISKRFIYFSPRAMTDAEPFDMVLKWPPSGVIYIPYSASHHTSVAFCWGKDIRQDG